VLGIHRATKPFKSIVTGVRNLYIVHNRLVANSTKRDAIDLIVGLECNTGVFNTHIAQDTGVVVIHSTAWLVTTAVKAFYWINTTFNETQTRSTTVHLVGLGLTQENQAAPVAIAWCSFIACEHNGLICRTIGNNFSATGHNQCTFGCFVAFDDRTRLNGQCSATGHIHET